MLCLPTMLKMPQKLLLLSDCGPAVPDMNKEVPASSLVQVPPNKSRPSSQIAVEAAVPAAGGAAGQGAGDSIPVRREGIAAQYAGVREGLAVLEGVGFGDEEVVR